MIFEIINSDGKRVFFTESKSCLPSMDTLKQMSENKYKFKLDGKTSNLKKIKETIGELK